MTSKGDVEQDRNRPGTAHASERASSGCDYSFLPSYTHILKRNNWVVKASLRGQEQTCAVSSRRYGMVEWWQLPKQQSGQPHHSYGIAIARGLLHDHFIAEMALLVEFMLAITAEMLGDRQATSAGCHDQIWPP